MVRKPDMIVAKHSTSMYAEQVAAASIFCMINFIRIGRYPGPSRIEGLLGISADPSLAARASASLQACS